jgi:pimeloyl-ACP methyl ester carboxylesterase
MYHQFVENKGKPVLVCIPGLLGGPEDFRGVLEHLQSDFSFFYVDPNQGRKEKGGLSQLSLEETIAVSYDSSAEEIKAELSKLGIKQAYFIGLSIGGKVVYDFAIRYPESFSGAVISDVGPSSCIDSELYRMVDHVVAKTDLNLPWEELKKSLKENIPDRSLRSLIQSQISYPGGKPPAIWKTGMRGLRTLLRSNSIDDQSGAFDGVNPVLVKRGVQISVLHSSQLSGITPDGLDRIKKDWSSIRLFPISNSGHFLHVTHKDELQSAVSKMISK